MDRERTYTWEDPSVTPAALATTSGLDMLKKISKGELPRPPILDTLGIDPVEVDDGRVVFELTPQEWHYNPIGSVHGGVIATLADSALGCAVQTKLPAGVGYTSLEIKLNFVRGVTIGTGNHPLRGQGAQRGPAHRDRHLRGHDAEENWWPTAARPV